MRNRHRRPRRPRATQPRPHRPPVAAEPVAPATLRPADGDDADVYSTVPRSWMAPTGSFPMVLPRVDDAEVIDETTPEPVSDAVEVDAAEGELVDETALTREDALAIKSTEACAHCRGYHARACPRVKRMKWHPDGKIAEVEFWADGEWSDAAIVWPEDLAAVLD